MKVFSCQFLFSHVSVYLLLYLGDMHSDIIAIMVDLVLEINYIVVMYVCASVVVIRLCVLQVH